MEKFNYDSYMRDNLLMKEADESASVELEFAIAEKKPDFQKDLKVYGIKVEPSGDKKKKYSGQKDELHSFVTKNWGLATAKAIDETSGYGNYTKPETMLEDEGNAAVDEFVDKLRQLTQNMAKRLSDSELEYLTQKLQKWADSGFQAPSL